MKNAITAAILALTFANVATADTVVVVDYGPALECKAPVGGVSECKVKATGTVVQCSMVNNLKVCF